MAKKTFDMGVNSSMKPMGIAPPDHRVPKHTDATRWVTNLVVDLKLQLMGEQPVNPITMERLNEWSAKVRNELDNCTEYIGIKY